METSSRSSVHRGDAAKNFRPQPGVKTPLSWRFLVSFVGLIGAIGAVLGSQRHQTLALRRELQVARLETGELIQLRAENQRLKAQVIPDALLERLRADHAALPRLRAELEGLRKASDPPGR